MADDFEKKVGAFGQNLWQKAQRTIDIVSINNDISAKERKLHQLYAKVGEAYCAAHIEDAQTEFPDICEEAFALTREIASLRATRMRIKGYRECPACHTMAEAEAAYCPACGTAMPEPAPPPPPPAADDGAHCRQCGADMGEGDRYCHNCGTKRD